MPTTTRASPTSFESRADVTRGVVVVRPVPGVVDARRLAADVLIAMGKHYDAISRERQSRHGWELARLWAHAERVRDLVVWDARRLPSRLWNPPRCDGRGMRSPALDGRAPRPEGKRRAKSEARCRPAELLSELPVPSISEGAVLDEDLVLPQESFLTFRWACMQRMAPERFSQIDAVYREAHGATRTWLEGRRWQDRPGREEVARQLRAITSACRSPSETVVRLRAAQAAYFRDGVLVQVDDVGPRREPDVPAAGLGVAMAVRLRRLVTPAWAGALALGSAGGLSTRTLSRLKVGDLSCDGEVLTVAGESIDVPVCAAGLVQGPAAGTARRRGGGR